MRKILEERKYLIVCSVMALTFLGLAVADARADDRVNRMPSAEKIIEKHIEATGGRKAMEKYDSLKLTGTFSMPAMGVTAPLTTYQKAPNLGYTMINSDAFGTIESGSDGTVQWEKTMMTGAKIKEGDEAAVAERQGTFNLLLRWQDFYVEAETVAVEEVNGVSCFKVVMTPKVGNPETSWFDTKTYLLVKQSMTMESDMGVISMDAYPSDYREVGGLLVPFVAKQILMGMQELVITTEEITWNPEIPEGTFDLPEDIKALQK
jgi:hypothetical protein